MGVKGKNSYTIEDELLACDGIFDSHESNIVDMINSLKKEYSNGRDASEPLKPKCSTVAMDLIDELKIMESYLDFEYALVQMCFKENKLSSSKRTAECKEIYIGHVERFEELNEEGHNTLRALNLYRPKNGKQL